MDKIRIALACIAMLWRRCMAWAADSARPADPKRSWINGDDHYRLTNGGTVMLKGPELIRQRRGMPTRSMCGPVLLPPA